MNKYLIRNDEFWSTVNSTEITEIVDDTDEDILIDSNSGTLLGTEKINEDKLVIFNKLKDRVEKFKFSDGQEYPNYFKYTTYNKGNKVIYGNEIWESLSDNNLGSIPPLSTKWILSSALNSIRSIQIVVSVNPIEGGISNPIGIISIPSDSSVIEFKITPNPGYELNSLLPCLIDEKDYIPLDGNDYDYSVPTNKIIVTNWKNILTKNKLIFNMKYVGSKLIFFSTLDDKDIIDYTNWGSSFNETNYTIESMEIIDDDGNTVSKENNPYISPSGELTVPTNKSIKLIIPELVSYFISSVKCKWIGSIDEDNPSTLIPEIINYKNVITIPKSKFTIGELTFKLEPKKVMATISEFSGFEISNNSIKVISGSPVTFKFIDSEYITLPDGTQQLADNLDKIVLTDNQGNYAEISRFSSNGSGIVFGYSSVYLTRVDQPIGSINYGEYTLKISNLYFNTNIKILKS